MVGDEKRCISLTGVKLGMLTINTSDDDFQNKVFFNYESGVFSLKNCYFFKICQLKTQNKCQLKTQNNIKYQTFLLFFIYSMPDSASL